MNSNVFSAADMSTAVANGHRDGYQAGYADAVKAFDAAQPAAAQEAVRQPDGYHYRYGAYIRKNNGGEVNGSKPVEAVPYWYAPVAAAPVDGRDVRSAIAGLEGSVAVGSDGEWVSVRRTARDAAVTALRNLSSDCAHIYAAYAETKASTPAAPVVPNGKLVGWWNGITPGYDGQGIPSIRWGADAENGGHDIPLYDGYNPIHYQQPTPAGPGIDLEQFREAVECQYGKRFSEYEDGYHSGAEMDEFEDERRRLLALIDASPKGGSDATTVAALHAAVAAIYFDDSSDYQSALWTVVKTLSPDVAALLERDAAAAYAAIAPQATSAEVGA